MESLISQEITHLSEMLKLKGSIADDYLAAFLDGVVRETYLRLKLLELLRTADVEAPREPAELGDILRTLDEMCARYEQHIEQIKRLRQSAKTPLELELISSVERSLERTHLSLRMLMNALSAKRS